MPTEFTARLQEVDKAMLTPLVREVIENESAEVLDWTTQPVTGGSSQETGRSYGLYRFEGSAQIRDKIVPWSLILKAKARSSKSTQDPKNWNYWKREILAYQSGLLAELPGDIVAPRCFGVFEYPGDEFWVWLEDIPAESEARWSLNHFGLAARHLGQFNGAYLAGQSLPKEPWLSKGRVRGWLSLSENLLPDLPKKSQHPLVQRWFDEKSVKRTLALWHEREKLLDALDQLPRSLCHHDAFRRNLILRQNADGQMETVAVDWEIVGIGTIGEEIGTLFGISLQFLEAPISQAKELDSLVFEGYLKGLQDAGWTGDERLVRFGFAATTALYIGVGAPSRYLTFILSDEGEDIVKKIFNCTPEYLLDQYAHLQSYLLDLGDEARALLNALA